MSGNKTRATRTKSRKAGSIVSLGRPTVWEDRFIEEAHNLTLLGYTDSQLSNHFAISEDTLHQWRKKMPLFSDAIRSGRAVADGKVVESLYRRATGYTYVRKVPRVLKTEIYDESGKKVATREEVVIDHEEVIVPPDVRAQQMWLYNRQRNLWKSPDTNATLALENNIPAGIQVTFVRPGVADPVIVDVTPEDG